MLFNGLLNSAFAADTVPAVAVVTPPPSSASPFTFPLLMLGFFVVFYFLILRPQNKRLREQRELIGSLQQDDEVLTTSGIVGKIVKMEENFIHLKISDSVTIMIQKSAIASALPKGSITPSLACWL